MIHFLGMFLTVAFGAHAARVLISPPWFATGYQNLAAFLVCVAIACAAATFLWGV